MDFDYESFCGQTEETETDLANKINTCLEYINGIQTPDIFLSNAISHKLLVYLNERYEPMNRYISEKILEKTCLCELFVAFLAYYKEKLQDLCAQHVIVESCPEFEFFNELLILIMNIENCSKAFCYKIHDLNGTRVLLDYLKDIEFMQSLVDCKFSKHIDTDLLDGEGCFVRIVTTFYNLTSIFDYKKKDFENMNTIDIVLKLIDQFKDVDEIRMLLFVLLANVVKDYDIETLPCIQLALIDIMSCIKEGADAIAGVSSTVPIYRIPMDVDPTNELVQYEDVCLVSSGWNLIELFNALYRLAINDKTKVFINERISGDLRKIIYFGNNIEKEYALKLLWQLCFDNTIAVSLKEDSKLLHYVGDLLRSDQSNVNIKRFSDGILWSINKVSSQKNVEESQKSFVNESKKHIMISYNSQSRELCLKIKAELERSGYKIWIDVENIHGSSLEAMARAIEESQIVLICMTEKYKQSPNCRAEAEYAFQRNVPIVPLIMQPSYMPDGWLGIILGSKIFINYTKYSFEECMRRLYVELKPFNIQANPNQTVITTSTELVPINAVADVPKKESVTVKNVAASTMDTIITTKKQNIKSWTNVDVRNWVAKNDFHDDLTKTLIKLNGEHLYSMNTMRLKAPESFYKLLTKSPDLDLYSVLNFNCEFEKLFED